MLKRQAGGPKTARKKKKGNATYSATGFDPTDDEMAVEDIRVWDISTSETTGRMTANRRTLKHYHQTPSNLPEGPSTSERPGGIREAVVEDTGTLADTESLKKVGKQRRKRKRVRTIKENDSVSDSLISLLTELTRIFQTKMEHWLEQHSSVFMDESLRRDGLGDALGGPACPNCSDRPAQFRCSDCPKGQMRCSACIVLFHKDFPLHRLQVRQVFCSGPT